MAKAEPYVPPPDPDFEKLAREGHAAFMRDRPRRIAFDTETPGFGWNDHAFCFTVAWVGEAHYFETSEKFDSTLMLREMFEAGPALVGHNIKFDLHRALHAGVLQRDELVDGRIDDTEALAHLDDEHRPKKLKTLALEILGYDDIIEVETKSGPNKGEMRKVPREKHELDTVRRKLKLKKDDGFHLLPRAVILPYAIKDAEFTRDLYRQLLPRIQRFEDLSSLYRQELELTLCFLDLERHGLGIVPDYVDEQVREYTKKVLATEERIKQITGKEIKSALTGSDDEDDELFNPNSNPQLKDFFTAAGHPRESYDANNLAEIDHPLAKAIVELRSDLKIRNTYFLALKHGEVDGIYHPSIRQHGTVTGRTSSGAAKGD